MIAFLIALAIVGIFFGIAYVMHYAETDNEKEPHRRISRWFIP